MLQRMCTDIEATGLGVCRACADNIGGVIYHIATWDVLDSGMLDTQKYATLFLKTSKCKAASLARAYSEMHAQTVHR